jgi:hypothetical protein
MSTVTYDRAHVPAATATAPAKRPGRWLRLYYRLLEAREKSALAELHRHGLRLPQELEQAGWKINERSEDSLPFIR